MNMLGLSVLIAALLVSVIALIFQKVAFITWNSFSKRSPFECGFSPWESSHQSFSLHFFLISLIFLIFDVELAIIFPMIPALCVFNMMMPLLMFFIFFWFMALGLGLEWGSLKLEWSFY